MGGYASRSQCTDVGITDSCCGILEIVLTSCTPHEKGLRKHNIDVLYRGQLTVTCSYREKIRTLSMKTP